MTRVTPRHDVTARPTAGGHVIDIVGLSHRYGEGEEARAALDRVDLRIDAGEFVCLVGPSGCGKTTLLQLIAGFVRPSAGAVTIDGQQIVGPGRDRAVVFQHPTSLYPWLSVRRNVELGLRLRRLPRQERAARVDVELQRVGLLDVADRLPAALSGGMQQRCQIARVLANDPDVMLMDEPFGALDAITRERLQDELRTVWQETGRTIVLVTHSVDEAALLGSRILVLSARPGRVVLDLANDLARSDLDSTAVRSLPEFTALTSHLRATIQQVLA